MCLEICQLDPAKFLSALRLAWQAAFKKNKLELPTDVDMLLMVEKGHRGDICHSFNRYVTTANNKYMKDKESPHLKYWDISNLYDWAMTQKLPVFFFWRYFLI